MKVETTALPGVLLLEPKLLGDHRGWFVELYEERRYREAGVGCRFVQDNMSRSGRGTLRGLHYQLENVQAKLVMPIEGVILDVAVDARRSSPTFGRHVLAELDAQRKQQLFVPEGFAHGFLVLTESAVVAYKCSDFYNREAEAGIRWDDPTLAIPWPIHAPILSAKDAALPLLEAARLFD